MLYFARVGYVQHLRDGKEEELAAEEMDEGGGWHGAEADEGFLGCDANDELGLNEQDGQPWCRGRIKRERKMGRKLDLPNDPILGQVIDMGKSQSHSSSPHTVSAPPFFTTTSSEDTTPSHLLYQTRQWLSRTCMPVKDSRRTAMGRQGRGAHGSRVEGEDRPYYGNASFAVVQGLSELGEEWGMR